MSFRVWLEQLRSVRGSKPEWPVLLGAAMDAEFQRARSVDDCYKNEVFIDRDEHHLPEGQREERLVAGLFRSCHEHDGCIHFLDEPIWLLGFQWPNQGGAAEKGRRADLVGMTRDGGIVVLEAKRSDGESPFTALVEGLDYLACLLRPKNFAKIENGFQKWKVKPGRIIPSGFESIVPALDARPAVIILGPEAYFTGTHSRSIRSRDWPPLLSAGETMMPSVRIGFAVTDFRSPFLIRPSPGN